MLMQPGPSSCLSSGSQKHTVLSAGRRKPWAEGQPPAVMPHPAAVPRVRGCNFTQEELHPIPFQETAGVTVKAANPEGRSLEQRAGREQACRKSTAPARISCPATERRGTKGPASHPRSGLLCRGRGGSTRPSPAPAKPSLPAGSRPLVYSASSFLRGSAERKAGMDQNGL